MNIRFYDHFSCWTAFPAAQAWDTVHRSIVQNAINPWVRRRKQGFYGTFDYREKVFHLNYCHRVWYYSQSFAPDIRLELLPCENGCDVDVEIRVGMFPLLCLIVPIVMLTCFYAEGLAKDVFPQDLKIFWLIAVASSALLAPFQIVNEVNAARNAVIELLNARDIKQLERRKPPKPQPVIPSRKVQPAIQTAPAFHPPKGRYQLQMLCPLSLEDASERLDHALRYPASGFTGIREHVGWRLTSTEGKLGLRSSIYVELFEHPEGCYVAGTVQHHPLVILILFLMGSPLLVVTLVMLGGSILDGVDLFGIGLSFVFLTPSLIVWGAGAAMLMKSGEHLCSAVRNYLEL